jgi:RluA family pseudouridine synthase
MERHYHFIVASEYQGYTAGAYLERHLLDFNAGKIRKMFYDKLVLVNKEIAEPHQRLYSEDKIEVALSEAHEDYVPKPPELEILFENADFLVVNKPSGIPVVPERWVPGSPFKKSLWNYFAQTGQECDPRIVHRIDKETSGAVVVAKTHDMKRYLGKLFEDGKLYKEYTALVAGTPPANGRIELSIAQASKHSSRMTVSEFGKHAVTNYEVVEMFRDFALLKVTIETGRTHQIRVHMAANGYPLAVDSLYGYRSALLLSELKRGYQPKKNQPERPLISRLTLHAHRIAFPLPGQEEPFAVEAPLPKDFQLLLKMLRKYRSHGAVPADLPEEAMAAGLPQEEPPQETV